MCIANPERQLRSSSDDPILVELKKNVQHQSAYPPEATPLEREYSVSFESPDLYLRPPDSGVLPQKLRDLRTAS